MGINFFEEATLLHNNLFKQITDAGNYSFFPEVWISLYFLTVGAGRCCWTWSYLNDT